MISGADASSAEEVFQKDLWFVQPIQGQLTRRKSLSRHGIVPSKNTTYCQHPVPSSRVFCGERYETTDKEGVDVTFGYLGLMSKLSKSLCQDLSNRMRICGGVIWDL